MTLHGPNDLCPVCEKYKQECGDSYCSECGETGICNCGEAVEGGTKMKHLYGGMDFQELRSTIDKQTSSLVQVKRVFSPIPVGSLVRVHMLEVTHDAPEGASLNIYKDYYKGVLDLFTPDMLKIIVRTELENEPTNIRIDIEQVIDAPKVLASFDFEDDDNREHAWSPEALDSVHTEKPKSDYVQDIIEYLDDNDKTLYIIEVI